MTAFNGVFYSAVEDCTRFVASTLSWVPGHLGDAGQWLTSARSQGLPTGSTPQVGAVAVFTGGQSGADPSGHVGVVTSVQSPTSFTIAESNFSRGSGQTDVRQITGAVGSKVSDAVSGFIYAPNSAAAAASATAATGAGQTLPGSDTAGTIVSVVPNAGPVGCQSLTALLESNAHGSSIPVIGGFLGAITGTALAPVAFVEWVTQPCKVWKGALFVGALAAGGVGLYLLFRREVDGAVSDVAKTAGAAAA